VLFGRTLSWRKGSGRCGGFKHSGGRAGGVCLARRAMSASTVCVLLSCWFLGWFVGNHFVGDVGLSCCSEEH
jgi:hypothetical protein